LPMVDTLRAPPRWAVAYRHDCWGEATVGRDLIGTSCSVGSLLVPQGGLRASDAPGH